MKHIIDGKRGEALAFNYLIKFGYEILYTNYKNKIGEIDIIAFDKKTLVFIEVKYRSSAKFGLPCEAVTKSKIHKIRNVAKLFLLYFKKPYDECRFDVIEICNDEINHILSAF